MLVTGASGFLGAHLCRAFLARGYDVRGSVRSPDKGEYLRNMFAAMNLTGNKCHVSNFNQSFMSALAGKFTYVLVKDIAEVSFLWVLRVSPILMNRRSPERLTKRSKVLTLSHTLPAHFCIFLLTQILMASRCLWLQERQSLTWNGFLVLLKPAVQGTTGILNSTKQYGCVVNAFTLCLSDEFIRTSVRRVVVTSSVAAVATMGQKYDGPHVFTSVSYAFQVSSQNRLLGALHRTTGTRKVSKK